MLQLPLRRDCTCFCWETLGDLKASSGSVPHRPADPHWWAWQLPQVLDYLTSVLAYFVTQILATCSAYLFFLEGTWVPEHFLYCLQSLVSFFKKCFIWAPFLQHRMLRTSSTVPPPCCVLLPLSLRVHEAASLLPMWQLDERYGLASSFCVAAELKFGFYLSNSPVCFLTDSSLKGNHILYEFVYMKRPVETNP